MTDGKRSYIGHKTCRLAVKVKAGTTGCNITCPELDEALTGAATSYHIGVTGSDKKGLFEGEQSNPDKEYDANGNMYLTWYIQVSDQNESRQEFNFTLTNQLNSQDDYITHFQLKLSIDPDALLYGDLVFDDCTIVHYNDATQKAEAIAAGSKAVGVVVYVSDTESNICEAGVTTEYGTVKGKAIIMALHQQLKEWCMTGGQNEPDGVVSGYGSANLFPNVGTNLTSTSSDLNGYYKTKYLTDGSTDGTGKCGHTHPAANYAKHYHANTLGNTYSEDYLAGSTGWFLRSAGQHYAMDFYVQKNGKYSPIASYSWTTPNTWSNNDTCQKNWKALMNWAGGEFPDDLAIYTSSEVDANCAPHFHYYTTSSSSSKGFHWDTNDAKTYSDNVYPILAY